MKIFTSIKSSTTFLIILIVSCFIIIIIGFVYYENEKENLLNQSFASLQEAGLFNETQISNWYKERLSDARFLLNDDFIHNGIKNLAHDLKSLDSSELSKVIFPMYKNHDYRTILVLDKNLKVILNLNPNFIPDKQEIENAGKAFSSRQIQNSKIDRNQISHKVYFDFYAPIYENREPLAVIILSVAPERMLYSFLKGNHFASETGESILYGIKNDTLMNLSGLRYNNISSLEFKIPVDKSEFAAAISQKKMDTIETFKDYRNENVLGDVRLLKATNWYLVTKIDQAEVFQSLKFKVIASGVIIFLVIGLTGILFIYINEKQSFKHLKQLNESEIKYKQIIEYASEGIVVFDKELNILQVNSIACKNLGYAPEELLRKKILQLLDPNDLKNHPLKLKELIVGETIFSERYLKRKDGSVYLADLSAKMLPDNTFFVVAKDITKKHEVEMQTKNSENKFRTLFESSNDAILLMDDIRFTDCNPKAEQIYGKSKSEIIGKTPVDFSPKFQPDGISSEIGAVNKISKVYRGKPQLFEWVHLKNGREIYCEINLSLTEINNKPVLIAIVRDISERKRIEKELIEAKERAEEMNRLKSNFLANMSHELRTPMVGILGFAQILKDDIKNTEHLEMIQTIFRGGKRLLETLNSILELTQIESKEHIINYSLTSINDLIKSKIINFKSEAQSRNLTLNAEMPEQEIKIVTDERLLKIVLRHLISNAIKFTEQGGVTIKVEKKTLDNSDRIIISVIDTGIGIPFESREYIFNEFRQASEGFNRKYEGSGLGLTITKKFIKLLDGDIEFESTLGIGTTFNLILPTKVELSQPGKDKRVNSRIKSEVLIPATGEKNISRTLEILIVEDDPNTVSLFKIYLKKSGNVDIANNAKEALDKTEKNSYDLILMDINLGEEIDGLMLTRMLRETKEYENTPIIAVTAFAMEKDRKNAFEAGCTNYLSKPFDKNTLLKMISGELNQPVYPAS